jgi:hypothetical protein
MQRMYGNRCRIRGARGRRLMRRRGDTVERSFAHVYDTGGMPRTHLRGQTNILKRILIHVSGFNLGLILRQMIGVGTPRGLQDRPAVVIARFGCSWALPHAGSPRSGRRIDVSRPLAASSRHRPRSLATRQ